MLPQQPFSTANAANHSAIAYNGKSHTPLSFDMFSRCIGDPVICCEYRQAKRDNLWFINVRCVR